MRDYNIPKIILTHAEHTGRIVRLREHYKTLPTRKIRLLQQVTARLGAIAYHNGNWEKLKEFQDVEDLLTEEMLRRT